jgi:DNA anti-recombination protein RmuC
MTEPSSIKQQAEKRTPKAPDTKAKDRARPGREARIKGCARSINEKYINPPHTTDIAILFLPTESLYAEVLKRPRLFEHLRREYSVTNAGPTTLTVHAAEHFCQITGIGRALSEIM